jgi:hypothetical protein
MYPDLRDACLIETAVARKCLSCGDLVVAPRAELN